MQRLMLTLGVLVALCIVPSCIRYQPAPKDEKGSDDSSIKKDESTKPKTDGEETPKPPPKKPDSPAKELPSLQVDKLQLFEEGLSPSKAYDVNREGIVVGETSQGSIKTLFAWDAAKGRKVLLPSSDKRYAVGVDVPPSISNRNIVAFTAHHKDGGTLHAFLWNIEQRNIYQLPSPLPLDYPETEVWDIGDNLAVGAIRNGKNVKACQWKLTSQGPTPELLPDPENVIARCISPNGIHVARWHHLREETPIAITDEGVVRKKSDISGVILSAQNAKGVAVGQTSDHQPCVVHDVPHLIAPLKEKNGWVTAMSDDDRLVGWYESGDPGSSTIAFTAVLP